MCWTDVYLEPPDFILYDANKNFIEEAFQANTYMLLIRNKSAFAECANSMKIVELYHASIRSAYNIITKEIQAWKKGN